MTSPDEQLRQTSQKLIDSVAQSVSHAYQESSYAQTVLEDLAARIRPAIDAQLAPFYRAMDELNDAMAPLLVKHRERLPQNWPQQRSDIEILRGIIEDEGIPLVYIPRQEIVGEVLAAKNRSDRVAVLLANTSDVLDDCRDALASSTHRHFDDQRTLLTEAILAYQDGHFAAAQALSVLVCDVLIRQQIAHDYATAKSAAATGDLDAAYFGDILRVVLAVAPVGKLLTPWFPSTNEPAPEELSRHVTVHHASPAHMRQDNALIAVMLATGLVVGFSEMQQLVP